MAPLNSKKFEQDLGYLISCFYDVLVELGHKEIASYLPWRAGNHLEQEIRDFDQMSALKVAQLLSISFQLLNMVEENATVQERRSEQAEDHLEDEPGLWPDSLRKLKHRGLNPKQIQDQIKRLSAEIVLTAHPTEAKRSTVLEHHRDLYLALVRRENQMWSSIEQAWLTDEIKTILERLWRTGEIYQERPDIESERRNIMHYLKNVFPEIITWLDKRFETSWQQTKLGGPLRPFHHEFPSLKLGTWVGGDRDGHPFVTAEVTHKSLVDLRLNALIVLRHRLVDLAQKASLSDKHQTPPKILLDQLSFYKKLLPDAYKAANRRNPEESFRILISLMIERLPIEVIRNHATQLDDRPYCYQSARELLTDLKILEDSLACIGADRIARHELRAAIRCVQIFGFHSATLDIRQNSSFHRKALLQLLAIAGGAPTTENHDENSLSQRILAELELRRPLSLCNQNYQDELKALMECYQTLRNYSEKYGHQGLGALIVSMTRSAADLFTVYLIARESGLAFLSEGQLICPLPVVPLFETIDDLKASVNILDEFLAHPITKASLIYQQEKAGLDKPRQQIMIGYSDSCKDGGILASQWHLYLAQQDMQRVAAKHQVELCFFHGRGGTVSRGAGPIHRFFQSLPPESVNGSFRMTEQGETISRKYANFATAVYNVELLLASLSYESLLSRERQSMSEDVKSFMSALAEKSYCAYRSLVTDASFPQFFREATPIDVLEQARIGSRPPKRTGKASIDDLRAIPWVFSWNQSRFYLPSWYGVGSALKALSNDEPEQFQRMKQSLSQCHLLNYVLHNVEITVASASEEIMQWYGGLVRDQEIRDHFMKQILAEFQRTKLMLVEIFGSSIEARRPHVIQTISMREQGLRLLHRMQIQQLHSWRATRSNQEQDESLLETLLVTINAIAGGLRNTG